MAGAGLVAVVAAVALALGSGGDDAQPAAEPTAAEAAVAGLTPGELAGERLIAGWDGTQPPRGLIKLIREGGVAGVILFDDNVDGRGGTETTIRKLQRVGRPDGVDVPLLVTLDQDCLLYTSPSPRDGLLSRMPSSA